MPEAASKIGIHMAKQKKSRDQHPQPAFVFDLDGTLIDRVYQHVLAWSEALRAVEIELSNWCIHRRIGMSDSLILNTCMRGAGRKLDKKQIEKLQDLHTKAYMKQVDEVQALPGAKTLLEQLTKLGVLWAIGNGGDGRRREPGRAGARLLPCRSKKIEDGSGPLHRDRRRRGICLPPSEPMLSASVYWREDMAGTNWRARAPTVSIWTPKIC